MESWSRCAAIESCSQAHFFISMMSTQTLRQLTRRSVPPLNLRPEARGARTTKFFFVSTETCRKSSPSWSAPLSSMVSPSSHRWISACVCSSGTLALVLVCAMRSKSRWCVRTHAWRASGKPRAARAAAVARSEVRGSR
eukprot:Amastigsp_a1126_10.p4 type:complete len:139 gc:universal Amastigsp_a1126_10:1237-1653(+)